MGEKRVREWEGVETRQGRKPGRGGIDGTGEEKQQKERGQCEGVLDNYKVYIKQYLQ